MPLTQRIVLADESKFSFRATVESHGWYQLPPFDYDREAGVLTRVELLRDGRPIFLRIRHDSNSSRKSFLLIETEGDAFMTDMAEIHFIVERMLCLDWDMSAFYGLLREHPGYEWVEQRNAGRLLRAPTVWEDVVKTLLTTNTTWRQTVEMSKRLTQYGTETPHGPTFPTPQQIANVGVQRLTDEVRMGYRAGYLHALAAQIVDGELNLEWWKNPELTSDEVYKGITALKGFGAYAAGSIMRLLGHHDRPSIDTEIRTMFTKRHNNGQRPENDAIIREHYVQYGQWRGLVMWMDLIADD